MIDMFLQLTKREIRVFRTEKPRWIGALCAGVILGILGPFGTDEVLRFVPRVLYWTSQAVVTFVLGCIGIAYGAQLAENLRWRPVVGLVLGSVVATLLVFSFVNLQDLLIFGPHRNAIEHQMLALNIFAICMVLGWGGMMLSEDDAAPPATVSGPTILSRLPFDKRGDLVSISVSDHYVDVTTTKGTEMLLMRLSDAIRETGTAAGLQIHRSHWTALHHIAELRRIDGKTHAVLSDGRALPVSRTYLPRLKEAGF